MLKKLYIKYIERAFDLLHIIEHTLMSSFFRNQLLDHKKPSSQAIQFHVIVALKQFLSQ